MNKDLKTWIKGTKQIYNFLKSLPINKLRILGEIGGLDMTYYKTKSMISKGLLIKLNSGFLPNESENWK